MAADAGARGRARRADWSMPGEPLVVLLSGGADSVCLLDVARELGAEPRRCTSTTGCAPEADADEALCRALCERLGVSSQRRGAPSAGGADGNVQAQARELRYSLAERLAATQLRLRGRPHPRPTRPRPSSTASRPRPGSRALLAAWSRGGGGSYGRCCAPGARTPAPGAEAAALSGARTSSNADTRLRARAGTRRADAGAARAEPGRRGDDRRDRPPAARGGRAARSARGRRARRLGGGAAVRWPRSAPSRSALQRLVLRELAERALGASAPLSRDEVEAIIALAGRGTRALDLGGGLRAVAEYGVVRFSRARAEPPPPVACASPAACLVRRVGGRGPARGEGEALLRPTRWPRS